MHSTIDVAELASPLRVKCLADGLSIRKAAKATGVPYTTVQRVLRANRLPDPENLVLLTKWLDISVEQLTGGRSNADRATRLRNDTEDNLGTGTLENVAHLLGTDRALQPEDVETLMVVLRSLYDNLRSRHEGHAATERAMSHPDTE